MVVILVVLTGRVFRFSLLISQLLAKAIPVRGAKFKNPAQGKPEQDFCFPCSSPLPKHAILSWCRCYFLAMRQAERP
ncbi:hypothetical protein DMP60_06345 [Klebsiella pneumoniae]|nr:hypothetical protein DMP60_06345 [Klebsiella pneumoniae]